MRSRKIRGLGVVRLPVPERQPESASSRAALLPPAALELQAEAAELWAAVHICAFDGRSTPGQSVPTLGELAVAAQQFSPRVSLVPPDGLLLEVKGSLHLFNGADGLLQALGAKCADLGLEFAVALAPTPLAATVAARVGRPFVVSSPAQLVGRVSSLSLAPLRWSEDVIERLSRMGVRSIGQVLRLPRAGFARRFGPALLTELDRLTGRSPDLRRHFQARERFRRRRELTYELENTETLLPVLQPLLQDLGRFLRQRQAGVNEIECVLRHRNAAPTVCVLRLASPVADVERLSELLGERLHALVLPEPVRSCEVRTGLPTARVLASGSLWQPGEHGGSGGPESPELIERLRVRLGEDAVYGLEIVPDHRPDRAWRRTELQDIPTPRALPARTQTPAPWPAFTRPLWLLPAPEPLEEVDGTPRRRGSLRLVGDVERVETGWWDGADAVRDYYQACDSQGVLLWIFRERTQPHRWFLHGIFG